MKPFQIFCKLAVVLFSIIHTSCMALGNLASCDTHDENGGPIEIVHVYGDITDLKDLDCWASDSCQIELTLEFVDGAVPARAPVTVELNEQDHIWLDEADPSLQAFVVFSSEQKNVFEQGNPEAVSPSLLITDIRDGSILYSNGGLTTDTYVYTNPQNKDDISHPVYVLADDVPVGNYCADMGIQQHVTFAKASE